MGRSILVVDDEENFLFLLDRVLSREGYPVECVDRKNFKVAILDIRMSAIGGVALLARIKKRSPSTQVIMVTGSPTPHIERQSKKYGAAAYLVKPIDLKQLKTVLDELMTR